MAASRRRRTKKSIGLPTIITILMAVISLGLGISNWLSQRDSQWEASRALVNININAQLHNLSQDKKVAQIEIEISNVGDISFLIRDIQLELVANGNLQADWQATSLLDNNQVSLPLGLDHFAIINSNEKHAEYAFDIDTTAGAWHIVDPDRTIRIPIILPVKGNGVLTIHTTLFSHAISLMDMNSDIKDFQVVNGRIFTVSPEYGFDPPQKIGQQELKENILIYPFSASQVLIINNQ